MTKLNVDPVTFAENILGVELWDKQKKILSTIASERRVAITGGHGVGKTHVVACAAIWWACSHEDAVVITLSPGWLQTRSVMWATIHLLLQRARYKLPAEVVNKTEIRFGPSNMLIGMSTDQSGRLQGFHSPNLLYVADESVAIDESFWPSILGTLTSNNAHLVVLSNPTINTGFFADCFGKNRDSWECFQISTFDVPNFQDCKTVERLLELDDAALDSNPWPMLTTKRWAKEAFDQWWCGSETNSPLWVSRVLGRFPASSSNQLFPLDWLQRATRPADGSSDDIICGLDPAGSGKDLTAAVACRGGAIVDSMVSAASDSRGEVLQWLRQLGDVRLVRYDSCGLGVYYSDPLRAAGFRCQPINVANRANEPERYINTKAERFWHLREAFQRNEISGLGDETLSELASVQWLVNSRGQIEIESKASVKAALGHSPDRAESLMLCLGEHPPMPYAYQPVATRQPFQAGHRGSFAPTTCVHGYSAGIDCGECHAEREDAADAAAFGRSAGRRRLFPRRGAW
jgi:phage terminase large subunit